LYCIDRRAASKLSIKVRDIILEYGLTMFRCAS
jgi:hypothetical protein